MASRLECSPWSNNHTGSSCYVPGIDYPYHANRMRAAGTGNNEPVTPRDAPRFLFWNRRDSAHIIVRVVEDWVCHPQQDLQTENS